MPTVHPFWLHRFALLTTLATFPLLFVGGLSHQHWLCARCSDGRPPSGTICSSIRCREWWGGFSMSIAIGCWGRWLVLDVSSTLGLWVKEPATLATLAGEYSPGRRVILQGALGGLRVVATRPHTGHCPCV